MDYQNLVVDFANRTRQNLHVIQAMSQNNVKVYEVTQLINSMLGLLIFPKENFYKTIPPLSIKELEEDGWKIPKVIGNFKQVENLQQLIRYLRNAIAHFHLEFYTDENDQIKGVQVWNIPLGKKDPDWKVKLTIKELESITEKFLQLIIKE